MFSRRTDWKLATNRYSQTLAELRRSGLKILDLTVSNPTRAGIAYDREAILHALGNSSCLEYDPHPRGLRSARQEVSGYYRERGETVDPEALVLTSGTSEAYSFVFRLLADAGDEILVPKPSYPLFEFLADLEDVRLLDYPLLYDHGWQIDFDSIATAVGDKTRAIVLVNPNNPTGSYVSAAERAALNRLCRQKRLSLLVDEVFLDYCYQIPAQPSFAVNDHTLTFTLSGLSKISGLPQMKLAWISVSGPATEVEVAMERLEIIADTYLPLSTPVEHSAPALLAQRKTVQPQLIARVHANLNELDRQLAEQAACVRLAVEGGWYAVLRVPVTRSDEDLAIALLRDRAVAVHPGHFYDFAQEGFLVLSLITPRDDFRSGIERLLAFFAAD
ncbi:MAG: pyridoxal phosphate-dependent aminotransferase [Acidobacteria bacterium]|nr:pyridoxal phosphate-dependent aminotransferase [Acidobacteriota bacterium]